MKNQPIIVGLTGASGLPYGLRLIECILHEKIPVFILISDAAKVVASLEMDLKLPSKVEGLQRFFEDYFGASSDLIRVYGKNQWSSIVASGSGIPSKMVVCPCSMGTLSSIRTGASNNLLERAADVILKERKKLILVPREMPYSTIHLENMTALSKAGVHIIPASPGFYHKPKTINDLVDFVVARILNSLEVPQSLVPVWGVESIMSDETVL